MNIFSNFSNDFLSADKFQWCLICEQVFPREQWVEESVCPNCRALIFDAWGWESAEFRKINGYPLFPVLGKKYEMYPSHVEG